MKTQRCTKCKKEKPLSEFHKHSKRKSGYNCWCKECKKKAPSWSSPIRQKKYYDSKGYKTNLDRLYGEGAGDWYESQLVKQNYSCAICGVHQDHLPHRLSLDHNHLNGKWRGLLCKQCNHALGELEADYSTNLLYKAIKYIENSLYYEDI